MLTYPVPTVSLIQVEIQSLILLLRVRLSIIDTENLHGKSSTTSTRTVLYSQADKCEFHCNSCEYLGYMLSPDGLTMAKNKIQAIQDWPEPWKTQDVMSFLGLPTSIGGSFMATLRLQFPSRGLTRKDVPWDFSDDCQKSFEKLKKAFTTALVLTHWIPDTPNHGRD